MIDKTKRSFDSDNTSFDSKRMKLSATAQFRKDVSSREFSKFKRSGKAGAVAISSINNGKASFKFGNQVKESGGSGPGPKGAKVEKVYEKLTRKERKKLRERRRLYYDDAIQMKKMWEELRLADTAEKKAKISEEIFSRINDKEKLEKLCYSHDTCRVIEWVYRTGNQDTKKRMFDILQKFFLDLAMSRYGKHIALLLVKHGSKSDRVKMIGMMKGKVKSLFLNCFANDVIEELYNNYCNESQRVSMQHEVYSQYFVMKSVEQSMTVTAKDDTTAADGHTDRTPLMVKSLQALLENTPSLRRPVLSSVKYFILKCIRSKSVKHSFAHKIIYEYFSVIRSDEEEGESAISEVVALLKESLLQMTHTPDGSKVVLYALWYSSAKDRKSILKMFKTQVVEMCKHEHGYLIISAIFDCVDDTILVNQCIIQPVLKKLPDLVNDKWACKTIIYILHPRFKMLFNKELGNLLSIGDNNSNSKKPKDVRYKECNEYMAPAVCAFLSNSLQEDAKVCCENKSLYFIIVAFLTSQYITIEAKEPLLELICKSCFDDEQFLESYLPCAIVKSILSSNKNSEINTEQESNDDVSSTTSNKFIALFDEKLEQLSPLDLVGWLKSKRKSSLLGGSILDRSVHIKSKLNSISLKKCKLKPTDLCCNDEIKKLLKK